MTTAGLHRRDDRPFAPGEQTFRVIPADAPAADIVHSHTSLGFDRVATMRDLIPATRFRGVVRFLQAFATGEEANMAERPGDVPRDGRRSGPPPSP